jgi:hypothetical protein
VALRLLSASADRSDMPTDPIIIIFDASAAMEILVWLFS